MKSLHFALRTHPASPRLPFEAIIIISGYHDLMTVRISPKVEGALRGGEAVVALESTVITHGLPRPRNLELALELERLAEESGAVPATIGIIAGELIIGLEREELERLATVRAEKASLWNFAALLAQKQDAGTTVATTLHAAAHAGIQVFATGGIGGVHPGPYDESADLMALARYPVVTVCAGPKSVLNVPATLERLESLGVPVVGYGTNNLAGFHVRETHHPVPVRCDTPLEVARCYQSQRSLGLPMALLLCKPVSEGLEPQELQAWIGKAQAEAERDQSGKDVTPFLLARLAELSDGRSVEVNIRLLKENVQLAASVAQALALNAASRQAAGAAFA